MKNTNLFRYLNDAAAIYIFMMTFAVTSIVTLSQDTDTNLAGFILGGFLIAFVGSILCLILRFYIAYYFIKSQTSKIRKITGIIYFIFLSILTVFFLIQTLYASNWSIIAHETLFNYTQYQLFMNVIMIAQWIGKKLFIK